MTSVHESGSGILAMVHIQNERLARHRRLHITLFRMRGLALANFSIMFSGSVLHPFQPE